jgi:8-oxo-dGTP pyrophosphatase MutT (NUDIX family)
MERRITTRGIIFKDGKLFAVQHKVHSADQFWNTAGGGLDPGEAFIDGVRREMVEETGIVPDVGKLLFIQQFYSNGIENIDLFFHIKNSDDYINIDLTSTSHGDIEIAKYGFIDPKAERLLPVFLQKIDIQAHIDGREPVFISNSLAE